MAPLNLQHTLVAYRQQQHLTQTDLAEALYTSRQTISNWETGKTYPDIQSLVRLANLYHVSVNDLVQADLSAVQNQTAQYHLKPLTLAAIGCLVAVYGLFVSLRWLPMVPIAMAIAALTTIGLALMGYLIHLSQKLQLKTFHQIKAYLHHQPAPTSPQSHMRQTLTLVLSGLVGLLIGGGMTWWIAKAVLHWSL